MKRFIATVSILVFLILGSSLLGQIGSMYNERDDQYRLLGLKRAKQAYETALKEYERIKSLYDKNLTSQLSLEQALNNMNDAEVNYQQSLLAVLFEKQYVSVEKAVKYHAEDGSKRVSLTLVNSSGGSAEFRKLLNIEDELFRSLQPDIINNVYVSILNDENAIISQPYEIKIPELRYGKPEVVDFRLLEDLDYVTVYMIYSNGNQRSMKIYLQKDASVNKVAVQSEQFSQEVELGETASYDMTLELFSGINSTFSLEVVNLPRQISRYFSAPNSRVRLSQIKFTESSRTKSAALEVTLPDRPTEEVVMDEPISFYVLVIPREKMNDMDVSETKQWTEEEIEQLGVGYVRLELVPRGKGELMVRAPQLYHAVKKNEPVEMYIEVKNEGTHRLDNIEIETDLPFGWTKTIEPSVIESLAISRDKRVHLSFTPPEDIAVGKYNIRIRTGGMSNNQPVLGEDKTVTVEIKAGANLVGTFLIVFFIVALVGGIVYFGIRLSKR